MNPTAQIVRRLFSRTVPVAVGLSSALLLEPIRCGGLPLVTSQAAEIAAAINITEGNTKEGFPYFFGGVSSNEREAMEGRAKDYNLKLVFADKKGSYLSGIRLSVSSSKEGQIFAMPTEGPWFYILLPAGSYDIKAQFNGHAKEVRNIRLAREKTTQLIFTWDLGKID